MAILLIFFYPRRIMNLIGGMRGKSEREIK